MRLRTAAAAVFVWFVFPLGMMPGGHADSWFTPTRKHFSNNGKFFIQIDEKSDQISLKSHGGIVSWTIRYPQGVPPVHAHVRDDGQYVVLQDQWGRVGFGKVLVFIDAGGKVLRSYTLEQILNDEEILDCEHTVSSRWWSNDAMFFFRPGDQFVS